VGEDREKGKKDDQVVWGNTKRKKTKLPFSTGGGKLGAGFEIETVGGESKTASKKNAQGTIIWGKK